MTASPKLPEMIPPLLTVALANIQTPYWAAPKCLNKNGAASSIPIGKAK
jgi:hypothetical protein